MKNNRPPPGKEAPPYVPPELGEPPLTLEQALEKMDGWGAEQSFGIHWIARLLREENERLLSALARMDVRLQSERRERDRLLGRLRRPGARLLDAAAAAVHNGPGRADLQARRALGTAAKFLKSKPETKRKKAIV